MALTSDLIEEIRALDLFDPMRQQADPFPLFNRMREEQPVAWCDAVGGFWIVSRHDDVLRILQDTTTFSSAVVVYPFAPGPPSIPLNLDGEQHLDYRKLLLPMFSPARVAAGEPLLRATAQALAESAAARGECEFVHDFAFQVPARAFLATFAIPEERLDQMVALAARAFVAPADGAAIADLYSAGAEASAIFREVIAERRAGAAVGDDVVSELLRARLDRRPLSDDELVNILGLLTAASLDTTASAMANMVAWLAENPDRRDLLVSDPSLLPSAIEELLRWDQMTLNGRVVRQEVTIQGVRMRPGDRVMMLNAATGRDPRVFDDPESVRFDRSGNRHLAFGAGPHRCLGVHLARTALRVALEEWHRAVPSYSLRPGLQPSRRLKQLRAVTALPLVIP